MIKILWVSPFSVHDQTNEAAFQVRHMIESLGKRNAAVAVLTATTFVSGDYSAASHEIQDQVFNNTEDFVVDNGNIKYIYLRTSTPLLTQMSTKEQRAFVMRFSGIISTFKPEIIITSGSDIMSSLCCNEAKRRGVPTVFILNEEPSWDFDFPDIDMILSTSKSITELYVDTNKHKVGHIGTFLPASGPLAQGRTTKLSGRKRILFLNPVPVLGLGIFLQFSRIAAKDPVLSQYTCTVLEFHEDQFMKAVSEMKGEKGIQFLNASSFASTIEVLPFNNNINSIFAETKVLMMPTLALTYCSRLAMQAISYCVPVVTSLQPSFKEQLGEGASYIEVDQYQIDHNQNMASKEYTQPWIEAAKEWINKSDTILEKCNSVIESYTSNDGESRLALALMPYIAQRGGNNPHFYHQGNYAMDHTDIDIHRLPDRNFKTKAQYKALEAEYIRQEQQRREQERLAEMNAQRLEREARAALQEQAAAEQAAKAEAERIAAEEAELIAQAQADLAARSHKFTRIIEPQEFDEEEEDTTNYDEELDDDMLAAIAEAKADMEAARALQQGSASEAAPAPATPVAETVQPKAPAKKKKIISTSLFDDEDDLPLEAPLEEPEEIASEAPKKAHLIKADTHEIIEKAPEPEPKKAKTTKKSTTTKAKKTPKAKTVTVISVSRRAKPMSTAQKIHELDNGPFALVNKEELLKHIPRKRRTKAEMAAARAVEAAARTMAEEQGMIWDDKPKRKYRTKEEIAAAREEEARLKAEKKAIKEAQRKAQAAMEKDFAAKRQARASAAAEKAAAAAAKPKRKRRTKAEMEAARAEEARLKAAKSLN